MSDQEREFRRRAGRRRARAARRAFATETSALHLTGTQIQTVLAALPDDAVDIRAAAEEALDGLRARISCRD